jgi:hypothetical protein
MTNVISELGFFCPKCSVPAEDCWEVLAAGEIHRLTCQCCGAEFNGLIVECDACGAEDFITSISIIDPEAIVCSSCGHHNRPSGADDEEPDF